MHSRSISGFADIVNDRSMNLFHRGEPLTSLTGENAIVATVPRLGLVLSYLFSPTELCGKCCYPCSIDETQGVCLLAQNLHTSPSPVTGKPSESQVLLKVEQDTILL